MQTLTHSRLSSYRTCPMKHHLRYDLGLVPDRTPTYFRFGTAWHLCQELIDGDYVTALHDNYANPPDWVQEDATALRAWLYEPATVLTLFNAYQIHYATDPVEVIAAEKEFRIPILNPETSRPSPVFNFAGKIDKLARWQGREVIMEYKTTADDIGPDSEYWLRLRIDTQISGYLMAARALGHNPEAVLYDVVRKPTIRPHDVPLTDALGVIVLGPDGQRVYTKSGEPRKTSDSKSGYVVQTRPETIPEWSDRLAADIASRPDWYFQRREIPRLASELTLYAAELWDIQQQIRESQRHQRHYRNTAACRTVTGCCEYFGLCTSGADPASVPPGYRVETIHKELTNVTN